MTVPDDPSAPLPRTLESALRREGLRVKGERSRGHVPLRVWCGVLGSTDVEPPPTDRWGPAPGPRPPAVVFSPGPGESLDHHDRLQVVLALTQRVSASVPRPTLWLTRSGTPEPCPEDLCWLSAAELAWRALGITPDYAVVTREGWSLHPSGRTRRWKRLRD